MFGFGDIGAIAKPVDAVFKGLDSIFTSDEERLTKKQALKKLDLVLPQLTAQLDMLNAKSSSRFIASARPTCVYLAGANFFLLGIAVTWFDKIDVAESYITASTTAFLGALGLYGFMRTGEKLLNKIK